MLERKLATMMVAMMLCVMLWWYLFLRYARHWSTLDLCRRRSWSKQARRQYRTARRDGVARSRTARTLQSQIQETAFLVQFVLKTWFLDLSLGCMERVGAGDPLMNRVLFLHFDGVDPFFCVLLAAASSAASAPGTRGKRKTPQRTSCECRRLNVRPAFIPLSSVKISILAASSPTSPPEVSCKSRAMLAPKWPDNKEPCRAAYSMSVPDIT
eukprot:3524695-Rhodomonas_salina.2